MPEDNQGTYDVIVIGAGIGGLTCGALLAKNGFKTLVLEQHTVPGGYCTSFQRKGFTFDAAVHDPYQRSIFGGALDHPWWGDFARCPVWKSCR